jgi:hypothetical protein
MVVMVDGPCTLVVGLHREVSPAVAGAVRSHLRRRLPVGVDVVVIGGCSSLLAIADDLVDIDTDLVDEEDPDAR